MASKSRMATIGWLISNVSPFPEFIYFWKSSGPVDLRNSSLCSGQVPNRNRKSCLINENPSNPKLNLEKQSSSGCFIRILPIIYWLALRYTQHNLFSLRMSATWSSHRWTWLTVWFFTHYKEHKSRFSDKDLLSFLKSLKPNLQSIKYSENWSFSDLYN